MNTYHVDAVTIGGRDRKYYDRAVRAYLRTVGGTRCANVQPNRFLSVVEWPHIRLVNQHEQWLATYEVQANGRVKRCDVNVEYIVAQMERDPVFHREEARRLERCCPDCGFVRPRKIDVDHNEWQCDGCGVWFPIVGAHATTKVNWLDEGF